MHTHELDQIDAVPTNLTRRAHRGAAELSDNKEIKTQISNNEPKSRRPKSTALRQQRLPAWQPVLTAQTVMPLFFIIGTIFVIIGAILYTYSNNIKEKVIEYTECTDVSTNIKCSDIVKNTSYTSCKCKIQVDIEELYPAPVYLYYGLTNFYQNHRRYVRSRDDNQLLGNPVDSSSISSECKPFASNGTFVYAPCGAIANSLFNDSFILNSSTLTVPLIRTGIAWSTDKSTKFNNPKSFENTIRPPNWRKNVTELDIEDDNNNGFKNEDLIVWMRTAALPNFRKFYRKINHSDVYFNDGLPKGNYSLTIDYSKQFCH
jgi:hypothetical protein